MKIIILFSIFSLFFSNHCFADSLPISDIIKEAREKATLNKTINTSKNETSDVDKTKISKQEIKENVTETLDDLKKVN